MTLWTWLLIRSTPRPSKCIKLCLAPFAQAIFLEALATQLPLVAMNRPKWINVSSRSKKNWMNSDPNSHKSSTYTTAMRTMIKINLSSRIRNLTSSRLKSQVASQCWESRRLDSGIWTRTKPITSVQKQIHSTSGSTIFLKQHSWPSANFSVHSTTRSLTSTGLRSKHVTRLFRDWRWIRIGQRTSIDHERVTRRTAPTNLMFSRIPRSHLMMRPSPRNQIGRKRLSSSRNVSLVKRARASNSRCRTMWSRSSGSESSTTTSEAPFS